MLTEMSAKCLFAGLALFARIVLVFEGAMSHANPQGTFGRSCGRQDCELCR